ncbi:MAG TPA: hypothetical protein VGI86_08770 [Acidimicrobiia bacterium]|jgi:hypothetical protein
MLSKFDDYPIHQTPAPIAHNVSGDRNAYDRYWFNGFYAPEDGADGSFYFGIGAALYPNLGIFDCGLSIVRDGEQHAFHASRRASSEPADLRVGPFDIDVIEPMRRIRVSIDPNDTGIAADLTFTARTACVEEGRQTTTGGGRRTVMDSTRFAQFGRWDGWIEYDGKRVDIDAAHVRGVKDRSWGVRPIAGPDPAFPPPQNIDAQIFFLWAPIHWNDRCTHFGAFENRHGRMWHFDGAILPVYDDLAAIPGSEDPNTEVMAAGEHEIDYLSGTRRAGHARIALVHQNGARDEIDLEPLLCFRMKGIGYMHPEWGHGMWKGELAMAGESWKCDDLDPAAFQNQHIQQVVRARCGNDVGLGVLEQISFGPHERYGFTSILDMAP